MLFRSYSLKPFLFLDFNHHIERVSRRSKLVLKAHGALVYSHLPECSPQASGFGAISVFSRQRLLRSVEAFGHASERLEFFNHGGIAH